MIIDPRAKRRKTSHHIMMAVFIGLLFGGSLAAAQIFSTEWIREKLAEHEAAALMGQRVLLQAQSPQLIFKSTSIGVREGSDLHTALMAEQDQLLNSFQNRAEKHLKDQAGPPVTVHIQYSVEARSGPLISLLRTETTGRPNTDPKARYFSTLIDNKNQDVLDLSDLFKASRGTRSALDKLLCQAIMNEKARRGAPMSIEGPEDDCDVDPIVSFLDDAPFTFTSTRDGKFFSGIRFYFHAGRIGAGEQGEFIITIPQTAFRDYLVEHHRTRFTSVPVNN
ncbi:MAG: hypothetical protein CMK09_05535 [Ponticaulis sp.]|nr:hypothetical protein [Ponticaulis sp.]|tara:strand:- start:12357 stop:13193 length:837 start_codon:yes stop_codon:yes gene_type:complete